MWGISDPGRLLKKKWGSAYELALELYSMATGDQPGGEATKPAAEPAATRGVREVERAHADAPTQEQRRVIISAIQQAGKARQPAADYTPLPPGTPGRVAAAAVHEAGGFLRQISDSVEQTVIGAVVDRSSDWIGKKASEILGAPAQRPGSAPSLPRLPLTVNAPVPAPPPARPPTQANPRPTQPASAGPSVRHGTDSPATSSSTPRHPVSTSAIWDRNLKPYPDAGPHAPTDIAFEPAPLNASYPPGPSRSPEVNTDPAVYPDDFSPKGMTPLGWANPKTKLVFLDTLVTAATGIYTGKGDSSDSFKPGTGHAKFLDFYSDGPNVYPQQEPSPVWSMCQFPMQYIFAIAQNIGEDWWVWPSGGTVAVTTQAGGISAASPSAPGSGVCNVTPFYNGSYQAAGTATVYSDMAAAVGAAGGIRVVCSVDGNGYLHAVAEACS